MEHSLFPSTGYGLYIKWTICPTTIHYMILRRVASALPALEPSDALISVYPSYTDGHRSTLQTIRVESRDLLWAGSGNTCIFAPRFYVGAATSIVPITWDGPREMTVATSRVTIAWPIGVMFHPYLSLPYLSADEPPLQRLESLYKHSLDQEEAPK
ncbi:hypothetical protein EDB85DRAFT_1892089 [Lactarius pseudohatsudake]|nr:hypothetical protein EDB85DRAFT_1892089 [Lactarius pseudohatsudake]